MAETKTTKSKAPAKLDADAAADLLGITADELVRSRQRGLAPGSLGLRGEAGVMYWNRKDLTAYLNEAGEEG